MAETFASIRAALEDLESSTRSLRRTSAFSSGYRRRQSFDCRKTYPDIDTALTAIRKFAPLGKPGRGITGFRGYIVGYDRFKSGLFGVYLGDHIVVGANLKSSTAAIDFIRSSIESRRNRIDDNERYR